MKQSPKYLDSVLLDKIAQNNSVRANIINVKLEKTKKKYLDFLNSLDEDFIIDNLDKSDHYLLNPEFEIDVPKGLRQERRLLKEQARKELGEDYKKYFNITEDGEPDNIFKGRVEFIMNGDSEKEAIINI